LARAGPAEKVSLPEKEVERAKESPKKVTKR